VAGKLWSVASAERWDEIVAASPTATGYHRRSWCEALLKHVAGYRSRAYLLRLDDRSEVLLPVHLRGGAARPGILRRGVSVLRNTYGGPIHPDRALTSADWAAFGRALDHLPLGRLDCSGSPYDGEPPAGVEVRHAETTHWLELAELPQAPRDAYRSSCQRALRKAERSGLAAARLEGHEGIDDYVRIYHQTLERWGEEARTHDSAEVLHDLARRDGVEFWGVRTPEGVLAAGAIYVVSDALFSYWHGAMASELASMRPANLLHDRLIVEARRRGCSHYDFNPTSPGLDGVVAFKETFGAARCEFRRWRHEHPWKRRLRRS